MPALSPQNGGQLPLVREPLSAGSYQLTPIPPIASSSILTSAIPFALTASNTSPNVPTPVVDVPQLWPGAAVEIQVDYIGHDTHEKLQQPTSVSVDKICNTTMPFPVKKKVAITFLSTFLTLFSFKEATDRYGPSKSGPPSERAEEVAWIASSHNWLDRKTCKWFGVCGLTHLRKSGWMGDNRGRKQVSQTSVTDGRAEYQDSSSYWTSGLEDPESWTENERVLREIPQYVLEYAPLVHLYSGEKFWPCDIAEHLIHTTPHLNYTPIQAESEHPNLTNLADLNQYGRFVYLQSDDNVEERPDWLIGESNIPSTPDDDEDFDEWIPFDGLDKAKGARPGHDYEDDPWYAAGDGDTLERHGVRPDPTNLHAPIPTDTAEGEELMKRRRTTAARSPGGRSDAPAILVVVEKGKGVVDAFWFYFYSYNLGNVVFNVRFGNHVGDIEHSVVRFHNGKPKAVYLSEHNFGEAYTYEAVEKIGKRVSPNFRCSVSDI